jgi:hypothetical protein
VKKSPLKRKWKKLDSFKFIIVFLQIFTDSGVNELSLISQKEIDNYIKNVTHAIRTEIEASTFWKYLLIAAKPYWTSECREAVKHAQQLRRLYNK